MLKSSDYSRAAEALATVAIAALGGLGPAAGAALTQLVTFGKAWSERGAAERDVWRQVAREVESMAAQERIEASTLQAGLDDATAAVYKYGPTLAELAEMKFDPEAAARKVIGGALGEDRFLAYDEGRFAAAKHAILAAYRAIVRQRADQEPVLIGCMQWLHGVVNSLAEGQIKLEETLDELVRAVTAAGTAEDAQAYLRAQISRWNESVWHPDAHRVSKLEQRLKVSPTGSGDPRRTERLSAEEALAHTKMLVVLGGPGSGKTWLARRLARETAEHALQALENGAALGDVELPLFTTWDRWVKTRTAAGDLREGLVQAALGAGIGDLGRGEATSRLRRTFTGPGARVLVFVDSLDEAAEVPVQGGQWTNLRDLSLLHGGWRVVVTSRFGAWQATNRGMAPNARVVEIEDLDYPADVRSFVSSWFGGQVEPARSLLQQIEARPDLQRAAVVPLILTFYCLLAEAGHQIPFVRRHLYAGLVDKLLSARWVEDQPDAPDLRYCRAVLRRWAWTAVGTAVTPTGLGNWADSFLQVEAPKRDQRALDHVAPRVTDDGQGKVTRRFVHHTLLEYFVAEHLAGLSAKKAVRLLRPHLLFDPDWEVTAPAAIAAHPDREMLLRTLLPDVAARSHDPFLRAVLVETDRLLLGVAAASGPDNWDVDSRRRIHEARCRRLADSPSAIAATSHWVDSNREVFTRLLARVPTGAHLLPMLAQTASQRDQAFTQVLGALRGNDRTSLILLPDVLSTLVQSGAQRQQALTTLLELLPAADPFAVGRLGGVLSTLVRTDAQRQQAVSAVLDLLPTARRDSVPGLARLVPAFGGSKAQRETALAAVMASMPSTLGQWKWNGVAGALAMLVMTEAQREQALSSVLDLFPGAFDSFGHWYSSGWAEVFSVLAASEAQRDQVLTVLLNLLPSIDTYQQALEVLAEVLANWGVTEEHRDRALSGVLELVRTSRIDFWVTRGLAEVMPTLSATPDQCSEVFASALAAVPSQPSEVALRVQALAALAGTMEQRHQVLSIALSAMRDAGPDDHREWLAVVFPELASTEEQSGQALKAVLSALPTAEKDEDLKRLARVVPALARTEEQRDQALTAVLDTLLSAVGHDPSALRLAVEDLALGLPALAQTKEQRDRVLTATLPMLPAATPLAMVPLAKILPALARTEEQRDRALTAVLKARPSARDVAYSLAAPARRLSTPDAWQRLISTVPHASAGR